MNADRRKLHRQSAPRQDPSLACLDELRHIAVAWVEGRVGVDDAHNGLRERGVAVTQGFDEDFAQEEREVRVA
jgi:hypothetical protein